MEKLGLILELEVLAGAEWGLEDRLNGERWKKLLVGLAEWHAGSPCRMGGGGGEFKVLGGSRTVT